MKFSVKNISAFILLVLGTVSCSSNSTSSNAPTYPTTTFNATLVGSSETPPNPSTATGVATLIYDSSSKTFTITLTHNVQNANAGHIHKGAIGVAGDVIFPFPNVISPITYTSPVLTDAQKADLFAGLYYVNIHSTAYPNGEIRGQLLPPTGGGTGGGGTGGGGY